MTLGTADKKKTITLAILGVALAGTFYFNVLAGPSVPRGAAPGARAPLAPAATPDLETTLAETARHAPMSRGRADEFIPVLRSKRPEDRLDASKVDPTLRLDLLAKVQEVGPAGGTRNLFQTAPAPPKVEDKPKGPEPKVFVKYGPNPPPPPKPAPPPPPPPPIPLTYYGIATVRHNGKRTAYFMPKDGDEILYGAEGETLKRRYRVVRISPNSVVMLDTETGSQQTLALVPESQS